MNYEDAQSELMHLLGSHTIPVAITFRAGAPEGIPRVAKQEPAGCGYWRAAAEGNTFYTTAEDHQGCPIGAHTHGVPISPEKAAELKAMVETMVGLYYLRGDEVAQIPRRDGPFGVVVYAPLAETPCEPDIVLVRGNTYQLMLLAEAVQETGENGRAALFGRPTCAALPAAMSSGTAVMSLGCIGNRVYTALPDSEAYFAIPGPALRDVLARLSVIVIANQALQCFHQGRLKAS